jgi:Zn-dependent peptidase ImmA (M78 family)
MPGTVAVARERARDARAALGLGPREPFSCLLTAIERDAQVPVVVAGLTEQTAGYCAPFGATSLLFVNGRQHPVGRQRFTLAHEFGHHVLGHGSGPPDSIWTIYGKALKSREVEANAFAAELLAPAAGVRELVDGEPTLETVGRVAGHFGLSLLAALVRLSHLSLTSRYPALRAELDDPALRAYVRPPERLDALATVRWLPRLPEALKGSLLDAVLRGDAAADPALSRALPLLMR